jgi:hypothetical protein
MSYRDEIDIGDGILPASEIVVPNRYRLFAAFVIAPALASVALASLMPGYMGLPIGEAVVRTALLYAILGAYPATAVLGVPAYMLLKRRARARIINCAVAGAIVAALPWFLLGLVSQPDAASMNGRPTVIDGKMTAYGWLEFGEFLLIVAFAGAIGGAIFWFIALGKWRRPILN